MLYTRFDIECLFCIFTKNPSKLGIEMFSTTIFAVHYVEITFKEHKFQWAELFDFLKEKEWLPI